MRRYNSSGSPDGFGNQPTAGAGVPSPVEKSGRPVGQTGVDERIGTEFSPMRRALLERERHRLPTARSLSAGTGASPAFEGHVGLAHSKDEYQRS